MTFQEKMNKEDRMDAANVSELVEYLKKNFKPTDKIAYMDCIEGVKNDCTYVSIDDLGDRFLYYVKKLNDEKRKDGYAEKELGDFYEFVDDNDVVLV